MSYDIYLRPEREVCPVCGQHEYEPELPDPTYNLTPIFDFALTGESLPDPDKPETYRPNGLRILSGRKAKDTIGDLQTAVARLKDTANAAKFHAMEPPNGWGNLKGATEVMETLLAAAQKCPDHEWEIR